MVLKGHALIDDVGSWQEVVAERRSNVVNPYARYTREKRQYERFQKNLNAFAPGSEFRNDDPSDIGKLTRYSFQPAKDRFVSALEDVFAKHKDIPASFWYDMDYNDLQWFLHMAPEDTAHELWTMHQYEAEHRQRERYIQIETDRRLKERVEQLGGLTSINPEFQNDPEFVRSASSAQRRAIEKEVRDELEGRGRGKVTQDGFWEGLWDSVMKQDIVQAIGLGASWVGNNVLVPLGEFVEENRHQPWMVMSTLGIGTAVGEFMNYQGMNLEAQRRRDLAEMKEQLGTDFADQQAQMQIYADAELAYSKLSDDEKRELLAIAGSEPKAMGLFVSQFVQTPTAQQQMADYSEQYDAELRENVRALDETEFGAKDKMLASLAAWGNFTADIAVGSMLLFDPDNWGLNGLGEYWDKVQSYDHSPAKVLGWEGTALGIVFDLGMTTIFDPTTWAFGTGAASAAGRGVARTGAKAVKLVESPPVVQHIRQTATALTSPNRGFASAVTMSGLDGIGIAQVMSDPVMASRLASKMDSSLWRTAYPAADEVLIDHLLPLVPDVRPTFKPKSGPEAAAHAINRRGGFNRPVEIEVTSSGAVKLKDSDMATVYAAVDEGWGSVPVQIKFVDDGLGNYTPDQIAKMQQAHQTKVAPTTSSTIARHPEEVVAETLEDFRAWAREDDIVLGSFDRGSKTYTVKKGRTGTLEALDIAPPPTGIRAQLFPNSMADISSARASGAFVDDMWYVVDDTGKVVAGYDSERLVQAFGDERGLLHSALKVSEEAGDSFLNRLVERYLAPNASFTEDAVRFMNNALEQRVGGRGATVDELWGDLGRIPDNAVDGDILRPASVLDLDSLFGETEFADRLKEIYTGHMLRNGRLDNQAYTAVVRSFLGGVKKVSGMTDNQFLHFVERYTTQRNMSRTFNTASGHAVEDVMDYLMRLFGDDADMLDEYFMELMNLQRSTGPKLEMAERVSSRVPALTDEIAQLEDAVRVPYDEATAQHITDSHAVTVEQRAVLRSELDPRTSSRSAELFDHPPLFRGDSVPFSQVPRIGDELTIDAKSASMSPEIAEDFSSGRVAINESMSDDEIAMLMDDSGSFVDVRYDFGDDAPALSTGNMDEGEYVVGGTFRVVDIEDSAFPVRIRLEYVGPAHVDDISASQIQAYLRQRNAQMARIKELKKQVSDLRREASRYRASVPNNTKLYELLDRAVDDYNRKYIASNPAWHGKHPQTGEAYIDPATGLVKRKFLRYGYNPADDGPRGAARTMRGFSDELEELVDDVGDALPPSTEAENILRSVSSTEPQQYDLGVSPLDLAVARELGGTKYMKWTHRRTVSAIRTTGHNMTLAWMIDKVFRPATAAVVTIDEAMRILHLYGAPALFRYARDKALFLEARVWAAAHGSNPLGREAVAKGAQYLSPKGQERIRRLNDYGARIRSNERTFFDQHGIGYTDIPVDDPMYRTYAREWTTQFLDDSGFRAYMQGPEAFETWWNSSADAAYLRNRIVDVRRGAVEPTMQDVYKGWDSMWRILSSQARKAGKYDEFLSGWMNTIEETIRTGRSVSLPDHVFDNFIPVRGAQKIGGGALNRFTDAFFDRLFMDPVNYRRGFIAEMVRKTEEKRLRQLYASQGKQVVSDALLEDMMRTSGWKSGQNIGGPEYLAHFWQDSQYIPESYMHSVIERTVQKEIENMLYVWNMGSRAGRQAQQLFPFGKPYADMMGFWGRELFKRPVLRGVFTNDNWLNLEAIANMLPINPRTGALLSRLAATDMTVDRGWLPFDGDEQEGLLPGSEQTDLSPLMFLPTQGDDILGSVLPGLGYIPLAMIDLAMDFLGPDPVEDPIGYNNMINDISVVLPYMKYQAGGMLSRVLGGGSIATLVSSVVDLQGYLSGNTYFNITSEMGDIGREIRRAREVSVLLSDPEVLSDIANINDPVTLDNYMIGLVEEANRLASASHGQETISRWFVPAKSKYDITGPELQNIWIDAGDKFPDILGVVRTGPASREGDRQYASDIRNAFFDAEPWERDLMIAAMPSLAVNMVSSWDWTPKAINAGFPGTDRPYSTGGRPEDMVRHDWYVEQGYVRPIQPAHRARLIVGQVAEARDNAIKEVYGDVVDQVNDLIWEDIENTPALIDYFQTLQDTYGEKFGTGSARQFWQNFNQLEELVIRQMEEEGEEFETRSLGVPSDAKPWGTNFSMDGTSARFSDLLDITLTERGQRVVDVLGLPFEEGMTGGQFHRMIADEIAKNDSLAAGVYRAAWDQYTTERLSYNNSASAQLTKAKHDPTFSEEWRAALNEWEVRANNLREQYADDPQGMPAAVRQRVVDEFNGLIASSKQEMMDPTDISYVAWDVIWGRFAPVFGERDWTPPKPLSPFKANGELVHTAHTPKILSVVDGDTLIVQNFGENRPYAVRLLGVSTPEYGSDPDGAEDGRNRLVDMIERARQTGDTIYFVTDPERFVTHTDRYGRMLAWMWVGNTPFYFEDEMNPRFTPSGSGK